MKAASRFGVMVACVCAAPAVGAQVPDAARGAFERGVAAMRAGRPADAATAFAESYRLRPVPVVLYNLGLAHRDAGDRREAWIAFARYVNTASNVDPERLAAVRAEMNTLRAQMGLLRFADTVAGTEITVDGRAVSFGSGELMVDPGPHEVVAAAPGHRRRSVRASVAQGESATVSLALVPEAAVVTAPRETPAAPATEPTRSRGWIAPVVIASVLAVAAGVTLGVYFGTRGVEAPPTTTGWTVQSVVSW